jgi:hypothetical protein
MVCSIIHFSHYEKRAATHPEHFPESNFLNDVERTWHQPRCLKSREHHLFFFPSLTLIQEKSKPLSLILSAHIPHHLSDSLSSFLPLALSLRLSLSQIKIHRPVHLSLPRSSASALHHPLPAPNATRSPPSATPTHGNSSNPAKSKRI